MDQSHLSSFSQAIAWDEIEPGAARGRAVADWSQGRATFGGLVAAIALRQMERIVDPERSPRSLTVHFIKPLSRGEGICRTEVLRTGKAVTLVASRIEQGPELCCVAHGAFASARESIVQVSPRQPPPLPAPETISELPYIEGIMPAFLQHVRTRWGYGNPPFSGQAISSIGGYCELVGEPEWADACAMVTLLDAWPTPAFIPFNSLAMASTIHWTIDFIAEMGTRKYCGPFQYEAMVEAASGGHAHVSAWLWDAQGQTLMRSAQLQAVYGLS